MPGVELLSSSKGGVNSSGGVLEPERGTEEEAGISLPETLSPPESGVGVII